MSQFMTPQIRTKAIAKMILKRKRRITVEMRSNENKMSDGH
jgi:hypothetical protein